jgi:hypothetical protein
MIDSLPTWKSEFEKIPKNKNSSMENLANYIDARVTGKMQLGTPFIGSSSFTFNKAVFLAPLSSLVPTVDPISGKLAMASAWQIAILASTMSASAGSIGVLSPATTFSVITPPIIPSPTLVASYAALLSGLLALIPTPGPSQIPDLFHSAFSSLFYIVTGINSIAPTPTPLIGVCAVQ